jgi:type IV pilus assembly protein PilB
MPYAAIGFVSDTVSKSAELPSGPLKVIKILPEKRIRRNTMSTYKRIGDLLIEKGLLTQEQLAAALDEQGRTGLRLGQILREKGLISEEDLVDVITTRLGIPKLSLDNLVIDPSIVEIVPLSIARKHHLIPVFRIGNTLTVAMADPLDVIALDALKYLTNLKINRVVSTSTAISQAIHQYYSLRESMAEVIKDISEEDPSVRTDFAATVSEAEASTSEAPLIKLVNLLITQAVRDRASDIHIEPDEQRLRIRYRVNGVLKEQDAPPRSLHASIVSRIKVMSQMDVSEKRLPQDGRFVVKVGNRDIDVRASTLPTVNGEKVVLRVLDRRNLVSGLNSLGFDQRTLIKFQEMIRKPEGLILITGPTGSGKTTTLYAALNEIKSIEKNIITIEDPVEYTLPLINQVQINDKAGLSFASALRSILRQNPDIIMVGEVRDAETAQMAVRSALTGHLVLTTIHTNDAAGAVARLIDMGVEDYLLASSLLGVLAQRLVRTICPRCKARDTLPAAVLEILGFGESGLEHEFYSGSGCDECGGTGYSGRVGIYEFLEVTNRIREIILASPTSSVIKTAAQRQGMTTLREQVIAKGIKGVTTYREILRVTQQDESLEPVFDAS